MVFLPRGDFLSAVCSLHRAALLHLGFDTELLFRTQEDIGMHLPNMLSLSMKSAPLNLEEL